MSGETKTILPPQVEDVYIPFELHHELTFQIKLSLKSDNRKDPDVRLELLFDKILFEGGLKKMGKPLRLFHGHEIYTIKSYGDLKPLLGNRWYIRALNEHLDFCYVNLDTVQFHLHTRQPLEEFYRSACTHISFCSDGWCKS